MNPSAVVTAAMFSIPDIYLYPLTICFTFFLLYIVFRGGRLSDIRVVYNLDAKPVLKGMTIEVRVERGDIQRTQIIGSAQAIVFVEIVGDVKPGDVMHVEGEGHRILGNDVNGDLYIRFERSLDDEDDR